MKEIASVVAPLLAHDKNFRLNAQESKVVIHNRFLYDIIIREGVGRRLNIYTNWKAGILGRIIWKKEASSLLDLYGELKQRLTTEGYIVFDLAEFAV